MQQSIPRIVIAATQSGSGKTTIVTGLLTALRQRGINVQPFKVGPDYIDPGYHRMASGRNGCNLDTWLVSPEQLPLLFALEAQESDIAVIEGVMGLYDGGRDGISSTAQIAKLLDAPVVLVIDVKSMGASAAAIAKGFRDYDPEVSFAGVILNRLGSKTHEEMVREALKEQGIRVLGAMRRDEILRMPERHLGLLPVEENTEKNVLRAMGEAVAAELDLEALLHIACTVDDLEVSDSLLQEAPKKKRCRIGIARDEAFSFRYPASIRALEKLGAEIIYFSPLRDQMLPAVDGLFLGGGFPEMFAKDLARNKGMRESVREAVEDGMPVYAECGGYMYLMEGLRDFEEKTHAMCGVFSGLAAMTNKLQMVGYVEAELLEDTVLGKAGTKLHGHEFHFSEDTTEKKERPIHFRKLRNDATYFGGQSHKNAIGSYLHLHFLGCPAAAENFVEACEQWGKLSL